MKPYVVHGYWENGYAENEFLDTTEPSDVWSPVSEPADVWVTASEPTDTWTEEL